MRKQFLQLMRTGLMAAAVAAASTPASAQTTTFKELTTKVRLGEKVEVAADNGVLVKGRVASITATSLTLDVPEVKAREGRSYQPAERLTFADTTIGTIIRQDSIVNGGLIGFLAGAIPGSIVGQISCGEGDANACSRGALIGIGIFGGLGFAIGAGIDESIKTTLYSATPRKTTLSVAPMIGVRRGVNVAIRF
jgi:hypothetical protein